MSLRERKDGANGATAPAAGEPEKDMKQVPLPLPRRKGTVGSRVERTIWMMAVVTVLAMFVTLSPAAKVLGNALGAAWMSKSSSRAFHHGNMPAMVWQSFLANNTKDPFAIKKVKEAAVAWKSMNAEFQFRILDSNGARDLVAKDMSEDDLRLYDAMQTREEKEIFLKLTTLFYHGGVFSDINIRPRQPVEDWIPQHCSFACGYEDDKVLSLVAIASAPKHRVISRVYKEVLTIINNRLEVGLEEGEPLLSKADFTTAVSMALTGTFENDAESLWNVRANIVKADPAVCLFKSRTSLHRLLVERVNVGDLFEPDPAPPAQPEPEEEAPVEAEEPVEADAVAVEAEEENSFAKTESVEEGLARLARHSSK